jgi:hypothetical protein
MHTIRRRALKPTKLLYNLAAVCGLATILAGAYKKYIVRPDNLIDLVWWYDTTSTTISVTFIILFICTARLNHGTKTRGIHYATTEKQIKK